MRKYINKNNISENQQPITETEISKAGKNIFNTFTKIITALGLKDNDPYDPCPGNFLIFYYFENIDGQNLNNLFQRYRSLSLYTEYINKDQVDLYFGVRSDGYIEYGISYEDNEIVYKIGEFRINETSLKWLLLLKTKSINSLKKYIIDLTGKNIKMLGQIKKDIYEYKPGNFGGRKYSIDRGIITFEYFGLDINNLQEIKNEFNKYVLSKSWGKKVLTKVTTDNMKVYFSVKLK